MSNKPILPLAAGLIYNARTRAGISKSELARRLKVSPSAVSDWEAGIKDPSVSNLYRVVSACGLSLRMSARDFTPADRIQMETDRDQILSGNGKKNAQRAIKVAKEMGLKCARAS